MTYLVDSDWVADYLDGRQLAVALLARHAPSGIAISLVTYGEIVDGIYYGHDPKRAEATFRAFLRGVPVLPLNWSVMQPVCPHSWGISWTPPPHPRSRPTDRRHRTAQPDHPHLSQSPALRMHSRSATAVAG